MHTSAFNIKLCNKCQKIVCAIIGLLGSTKSFLNLLRVEKEATQMCISNEYQNDIRRKRVPEISFGDAMQFIAVWS